MDDVHGRIRDYWNADAATYDHSPSHAATDPVEAAAWRAAMLSALPPRPAKVLDVGAGTGAMSLLAAELGYDVTALDLSPCMLSHAERKAEERGLEIELVVGSAAEPPPGPFDAVMERHVLWTSPDPVAALSAWRRAAPGGRLVLFEGVFARRDLIERSREAVAGVLRRLYDVPHDHHADYDPEVLAQLPLSRPSSPAPLIEVARAAGWKAVRIQRLRDIEWSRRLQAPLGLAWLETAPQYALVADD